MGHGQVGRGRGGEDAGGGGGRWGLREKGVEIEGGGEAAYGAGGEGGRTVVGNADWQVGGGLQGWGRAWEGPHAWPAITHGVCV